MSPLTVRRLTAADLPAVLPLLMRAAGQRAALEPLLWALHPDGEQRTRTALESDLTRSEHLAWFVGEQGDEVVGVAQSGLFPAPPVYAELLAGQTGANLCGVPEAIGPLLDASEAFHAAGGAALTTAVCAAADAPKRAFLQGRGYQPLTNWFVKAVDGQTGCPSSVRPATTSDLPDVVRLHASTLERRKQANARFWTPHPQAPERFEKWMERSLTLTDRDLLVSEKDGRVRGFTVVQPTPHLAPAHDASRSATLDDLAADDWDTFRELLQAAEQSAARRGRAALQVISPVNWVEKNAVLEEQGFHTANLWCIRVDER